MAKLTKEEIIESLKEYTVLELADLVKAVEEAFGVTAAVVSGPAAPAEDEAPVEKGPTEVSVFLKAVGASKLQVIKAVVAITGLSLMEAKKLTEALPAAIKEHISPVEAEEYKKQLTAVGAEVEVK
ncbi:MAG: 50S ribosomal protein L7/L12 [Bacilli bacterium]|nr:50S ribosomal protein L7/L12 [Bacilli bacterium]